MRWGEKHVVPDMWILAYNTYMYITEDMYMCVYRRTFRSEIKRGELRGVNAYK